MKRHIILTTLTSVLFAALAYAGSIDTLRDALERERGFAGASTLVSLEEKEGVIVATVEIPYVDIEGQEKRSQARLYMAATDVAEDRTPPVLAHVHYEKGLGGAQEWCKRGWAVVSSHYGKRENNEYPLELAIGNSFNVSRAMLQWVRRLTVVDRAHLHIEGGSAGGYMALAMAAEMFPVATVTADAPVANWAYNVAYLDKNKTASKYPVPDIRQSPLPVVHVVTGLADQAKSVFGSDLSVETWYRVSPISYLDRITCPAMVLMATGDMLVPIEQMGRKYAPEIDAKKFPEGYTRDFESLTVCEPARRRFDEILPADAYEYFELSATGDMHELTIENFLDEKGVPSPDTIERPWSKTKPWSLLVLEEGPPAPYSAHTRLKWSTSGVAFIEAHKLDTPSPSLLTRAKLERLLNRYKGELLNEGVLADGRAVNRANFDRVEKLDVVTGLLDYAEYGEAHAKRLSELYYDSDDKPFGDTLSVAQLRTERAARLAELGLTEP